MNGELNYLIRDVNETDEKGNGRYFFYYSMTNPQEDDLIPIPIRSNDFDFGEASLYCYYHGYMGGKIY